MGQPDQAKNEQLEQQTERSYVIRQVTHMQPSWAEGERGGNGKFLLQLILDSGVAEYIIYPSAEDTDVILKLFGKSKHTMWDDQRKLLIFANVSVA